MVQSISTLRYADIQECSAVFNQLEDYYNSDQKKYVKHMLDSAGEGKRKNWEERGIVPRARNITKSIVDKSGQLYNRPPALELWRDTNVFQDPQFNDLMESIDWLALKQTEDAYVRLMKTVVVYYQRYVPEGTVTGDDGYVFNAARGDKLLHTLLHKGNCAIEMDLSRENIIELAYLADIGDIDCAQGQIPYCVVTPIAIEDWVYDPAKGDAMVGIQPNPFGMVTAYVRYDTAKPTYEEWNKAPLDLLDLQNMYNLHLTDLEFAIAWNKQKTLFTNADIIENGSEEDGGYIPFAKHGHTDPGEGSVYKGMQQQSLSHVGQLGAVVKLGATDDGTAPVVDFKGPDTQLKELNDVMRDLVNDVAQDWDVNLDIEGMGTATSGFQLVVREINNLNLRERRAQFAIRAHRKEYEILKVMYPTLPDAILQIKFPPPSLPVDEKVDQEIWDQKINSGRASIIDYFMEKENLTEDEAVKKAERIQKYNQKFAAVQPPKAPTVVNENTISNKSQSV